MAGRRKRILVRILVGAALFAALLTCAAAPVPEELPALAFRQAGLYRLEIALLAFYGGLLLITPAFAGLIRGQLPIEISTRGAKFAEGAERSTELDEAAIRELEGDTTRLAQALAHANIEIDRLRELLEVTTRNRE